jgi:type I restriction enzyme S subunit
MKTQLGKLTKIKTGKLDANASSQDGEYPFFTCSREPLKISSYSYDCECVLVAGNGDLNVKYYNGKFDAYQRTYIIEDNSNGKLYIPYLYYFMEGYVEELRKQAIGGVIKYIKLGNLTDALIELPNIETQKKIVEILAKAKHIIDNKTSQIKMLDELIKSRFVEMFGDPIGNSYGWERVQLDDCLETIDNGKSFVCENNARVGSVPAILKLSAVTYGIYKPDENKAIIDTNDFVENAEIHDGDLLFTRKNTPELVGMSAYVKSTPKKLMMPDLIFRLNTKDNCHKVFLWQLINHKLFRGEIQNLASGSAKSMSNISKERLRKLVIALPPIELQIQFATFVHQVDKLKFRLKLLHGRGLPIN